MSQREQQALTGIDAQDSPTTLSSTPMAKGKAITPAGCHTLSDIKDSFYKKKKNKKKPAKNDSVLPITKCSAQQKKKMPLTQLYSD